ncbi:hypothetical protein ACWEO1_19995 [Kitasatospora cineracea]|uniref:hypothetical protein n=1 Tax=Kitasatospora sp. NRRL B-11411 TaxID=1463822 RepID=UPI0004C39A37|nr:hypothetical protein [Kitasatospora sp. NRRL B-11411]
MAVSGGGSRSGDVFGTVRMWVDLFGAVGAVVLGTVAAVAVAGLPTTPFMWVRGAVLLLLVVLLRRYVARARGGDGRARERLRRTATVLPFAVVGVDLLPGLCPAWYAVLQGLSVLALVPVAVLTRRGR